MVDKLYDYLFIGLIIALAILIVFAIIKSIVGPRIADRVVAVNMISTMTVMLLCTLTVFYKNEGYLADVSIIYVLISFVSIIVLANVFINVNMRKKFKKENKKEEQE
jgi:multicomponent Na+:H+ antiporter subunit F